ncbi:MAG: hypothetical protein HYX27_14455 [Acidobacteria bacterium]|nr:hypothetical protein [Acidobacteriota bacterium]
MPDRLVSLLLSLYPEEFRERYGPQIEADLYHPETNRVFAIADILRSAFVHRVTSPGPYIWLASIALATVMITVSGSLTLKSAYRILQPRGDSKTQLYALLFLAVFLVVSSVLVLAIHWLQIHRKHAAKCSKSRI